MSVSIQVTHSVAHSGKSTRRQIRISKQDLKSVNLAASVSPGMAELEREIESNNKIIGSLAVNQVSNLKDDNESEDVSQVEQPMSPRSQEGETNERGPPPPGKEKRLGRVLLAELNAFKQSTQPSQPWGQVMGSYDARRFLSSEFSEPLPAPLMRSGELPLQPANSAVMPAGLQGPTPADSESWGGTALQIVGGNTLSEGSKLPAQSLDSQL